MPAPYLLLMRGAAHDDCFQEILAIFKGVTRPRKIGGNLLRSQGEPQKLFLSDTLVAAQNFSEYSFEIEQLLKI